MLFDVVWQRFVDRSPVTVMLRATLENVFSAEALDRLFRETAVRQRPKQLAFSTVVDLLSLTVAGVRKSVNAAYLEAKHRVGVSVNSIYNKLDGTETQVSRELVRRIASHLGDVVRGLRVVPQGPFPGYRRKILDGNHLPSTDHRLEVLRKTLRGPLPGQALCVLEPDVMLITDMVPCEDGHAQERSLLPEVLETVKPQDLWIGDRNFCTTGFLFGVWARYGFFIIRQHASTLCYQLEGHRQPKGRCETGRLYEQAIQLSDPAGQTLTARRITLILDKPTTSGDREIQIVSNLPKRFSAQKIAAGYLDRWTIENAFQELEQSLQSEIRTLAYPKAALLAFALAVDLFNLMSVIKWALHKAHGEQAPRDQLSGYYLAEEMSAAYHGMMIALPEEQWTHKFARLTPTGLARVLRQLAASARPDQFRKRPGSPKKKPPPKRTTGKSHHHVSTARLLQQAELKQLAKR